MLKEKYQNVKGFVKEHKAEIIGGTIVIGGLVLRYYDRKETMKHLIDIVNLIDKTGDVQDKIVDVIGAHDKELKLINEVFDAQGKLNDTSTNAIKVLAKNVVELKNNK